MGAYLTLIYGVIVIAALVIIGLIKFIFAQDKGNEKMQQISDAIKEGAMAFLNRQYKTIASLALIVAVIIVVANYYGHLSEGSSQALSFALHVGFAFITGAFCSALSGYIGMYMAVNSNIRAAAGARSGLNRALQIALKGGAVTGLAVTALSLFGVATLFLAYGGLSGQDELIKEAPSLIVGFGFGASFVALFAQLGGGIYTKAADVGADLVGKVEAGIPEDDPRNPAVIADLVGDNVGDCAGRGADLFESTAAENIGAMILGVGLYPIFGWKGILFPLVARAIGIIASIIGIFFVNTKDESKDPMIALNKGYFVTTVVNLIALFFAVKVMLSGHLPDGRPVNYLLLYGAVVTGVILSYIFVFLTDYYTSVNKRPVQEIAKASTTGAATNIITGTSVGMESTALPVIFISAAIYIAYKLGEMAIPHIGTAGLYGTAIATMGMLSTTAYILAMDTFGPITDNAGGITEMSGAPEEIRRVTDRLDACGNTTKALTKGYAIGSAALATFLLFSAYLDEVKKILGKPIDSWFPVDIGKPEVFIGAFIGAMIVYLFSSTAIRAVGKAAQYVILEVRRQFREIPGIMEGTAKPDYARAVDIVTKGALKEMVIPGLIVVVTPILVGVILGKEAAAAFLMIGTISGVILALYLNNGGGAWDNAKKFIELGNYGGKGSDAHKASVVGDTVGDPFKDTAGPSLHVLIKLISTITLVFVALFR
ncbi:K(+)-stimulated pyrophosphate-energized sodium pump [Caldanaerobacter subterraneus subsp. tengcongensis MB4]|uniref:K(+)-insensitive pyrophosphate-energized proton pump n=1 Tax=Caldanaerobacter subterraneus subsp. tengcongensis (strain DSM 15242 / JCM 11007 / NBRC 100824 / MB4) TaxID=273068 RepID=HPPA_CALS4|nr:sodium-translocating pyrophosphatase [Caldanaerobacter subterraneus]Q8RCX1.1 RecName: Full=K(+)-insensitive pyrophosphate-energized proton pump; AltName: Full=Membrane-bound proton-translocating pyrophosphatase; AltName: Full=Pyrophosphate-energized inorganic pyrophosphatase; Short=H(+)-PPase [Caldanaerobacter subterraneus subsp. tengcongensis MB4]AAM23580.1 vacuolar-type H+-translocating inorganic pyrophosphatase [Caldanaerobacter subterraneus subsp. tengcongensis MB4]MCS3916935.1 K(+)-stimu